MQLILSIFYMHAFTSLTFINMLSKMFSQKARVLVQQSVYCESCKYAYFGPQNSCAIIEK
jgi:hypothetical protein